MDVVAHAGAIGRRVVGSKDLESLLSKLARRHLRQKGQQVPRLPAGVLSDLARRVGAGGVEVAESDRAPEVGLRVADVLDDELRHVLGAAIDGLGGERGGLGDGDHGGHAVDGGGGRVDEAVDVVLLHHLHVRRGGDQLGVRGVWGEDETYADEVDGGRDVVLVVLDRLLGALPNGLVGRDGDDCVDAALGLVRLEDLLNVVLDRDVALKEVDLAVGLVGVGSIGRERLEGELGDAV